MAVELVLPEPETLEHHYVRRFDLLALWRKSARGGAASVALAAVALAVQTENDRRRLAALTSTSSNLSVLPVPALKSNCGPMLGGLRPIATRTLSCRPIRRRFT